jgi:hypothetical protein
VFGAGSSDKRPAASAASVSALIALSATFALKTGLCVRHARLVMSAPDPRHPHRVQAENSLIAVCRFPSHLYDADQFDPRKAPSARAFSSRLESRAGFPNRLKSDS